METQLTETELLAKVNGLKTRHEQLKQEIIDLVVLMEQKETELLSIEEEYVNSISKMAK